MNLKLLKSYVKINILELLRNRSAVFFTIGFPVLLIWSFGRHLGDTPIAQVGTLIAFCNYAVQTNTFLSLGLAVSAARSSDWTHYLKTLPAPNNYAFTGMIVSKLISAGVSLILVVLSVWVFLHVKVDLSILALIIVAAFLGGIPMALLGIALGNRINPEASRGVMVFVNLTLLFATFSFPETGFWSYVRDAIPTYQWMMIALSHFIPGSNALKPWLWMCLWTLIFYIFAHWSYKTRRDLRRA